jgi:hypothetical protein
MSSLSTEYEKLVLKIINNPNLNQAYDHLKKVVPDIDTWESLSIRLEYGDEACERINTLILCGETEEPWTTWQAFEKVAIVLNGRQLLGDVVQELDSREIAYTVSILKESYPNENFNDDVCDFMVGILLNEGFLVAPPTLSFLQPFLPLRKLNTDQQKIQAAYIMEVEDYVRLKRAG